MKLIKRLFQKSKAPSKHELQVKLNTAQLKIESLESVIKEELYKSFMDKLQESTEVNRLKKENKNLRSKVKTLKSLLKE